MRNTFAFLIIGLFFGAGFGFLLAASTGAQLQGHDHGPNVHDHSAHNHGEGEHIKYTEAETPAPEVSMIFHPDGPQSRNMEIKVKNFVFYPTGLNGPPLAGHGHAHVYINGVKLGRIYSPWMHLQALPIGEHEVRVTLNANDHSQLISNGTPIETTQTLIID